MRIVKKLSPRALGHDLKSIKAMLVGETTSIYIGRIFGTVNKLKGYEDKFSGEVKFGLQGEFGGQSSLDNVEDCRSAFCYLPEVVHEMLVAEMQKEGSKPTQFAVDVHAKKNDTPIGYEFDVNTLIEPVENDPLNTFAATLPKSPDKIKALTAPVKETKALPVK